MSLCALHEGNQEDGAEMLRGKLALVINLLAEAKGSSSLKGGATFGRVHDVPVSKLYRLKSFRWQTFGKAQELRVAGERKQTTTQGVHPNQPKSVGFALGKVDDKTGERASRESQERQRQRLDRANGASLEFRYVTGDDDRFGERALGFVFDRRDQALWFQVLLSMEVCCAEAVSDMLHGGHQRTKKQKAHVVAMGKRRWLPRSHPETAEETSPETISLEEPDRRLISKTERRLRKERDDYRKSQYNANRREQRLHEMVKRLKEESKAQPEEGVDVARHNARDRFGSVRNSAGGGSTTVSSCQESRNLTTSNPGPSLS
ncbi:hypothetical protein BJ322DRAFT_1016902 [Thelephora terrestris]|uniref:Uncharacterized protein n=1 Tax=Thelephora terrestris TaxID=56493 RepID=A0A9P6LDD8_9AGAM|nr:hypothetical protein BJ322DRAFT_1016902 [Thelephora terrestris]